MSNKLIIYKDPSQREVGAVIDLGDPSENIAKSKKGSFRGKSVEQMDEKSSKTIEKINTLSKLEKSIG